MSSNDDDSQEPKGDANNQVIFFQNMADNGSGHNSGRTTLSVSQSHKVVVTR